MICLWFRIEFAFRGFAGYAVYDAKIKRFARFDDIPEEIANNLFEEFGVRREQVAGNCWWLTNKYLPYGAESTSPNFRLMDDLSLRLLGGDAFEQFCEESETLIDELLSQTCRRD